MSKELLPCPFCGGEAALQPVVGAIVCSGCHVEVYAPRPLPRTEAWNKRVHSPDVSALREELENTRVRLMALAEALAGRIGEVMPLDELVATIKQLQRNSADEGRADYFAALLTRLLATRQGRTVGYEPPEVQELWRKVEKAIEGKEGAK